MSRPFVVIADRLEIRAESIMSILTSEYEAEAVMVRSWAELIDWEHHYYKGKKVIDLIILDEGIRDTDRPHCTICDRVKYFFIGKHSLSILKCVALVKSEAMRNEVRIHGAHALISADSCIDPKELDGCLCACGIHRPPSGPALVYPEEVDHILLERIRSLDEDGVSIRAERNLQGMLRGFWPTCNKVVLERIPQGLSGAQVLLVKVCFPCDKPSSRRFVLKIANKSDWWKIENGVSHWHEIEEALNWDNLRHVPALVSPAVPCQESPKLVSSGKFFAAAYHFLDAEEVPFSKLEKVYRWHDPSPDSLMGGVCGNGKVEAETVVRNLLVHLERRWHSPNDEKEKLARIREDRPLWSDEPAPQGKVLCSPPYRLTNRKKVQILECLEELDPLGPRVLPSVRGGWEQRLTIIRDWVRAAHGGRGTLAVKRPVVLAPVHGDLNRHNILFWVEKQQFFLIDFDNYQPLGHLMQDFALLEAEIKFALMDCEDVALAALDLDQGQLKVWWRLEEHLASLEWNDAPILPKTKSQFIERVWKLVKWIREQARKVQRKVLPEASEADFLVEYFAALLYYTLRAIAHERLSLFKRLLAILSAARLIDWLEADRSS